MTGTTIAQAIPIAISPILTRIYSPEDFGLLAIYVSIATLLSVIATGRYEMAIMLPKKDEDSINLVFLSIIICISLSFFSLIVIIILHQKIINLLNAPEISTWLYLIPITVLMTGFYNTFNYWSNKKKHYKRLSSSRVLQSLSVGSSNLTLGLNNIANGSLILSQVLGQSIATLVLGKLIYNEDKNKLNKLNKLKIFALAKKYKKFPLINMFHAFINILKDNIVNIFIALKYSQATLGYYYFMIKLMKLPASLIGASIGQVFYRTATEEYNRTKDIQNLVITLTIKLFIISLPPILILYIYSEDIFSMVFGENWIIAGSYAKAISPYIFFHFLASPLAMVTLITNQQGKAFFWGLAESSIFVITFLSGYYIYNSLLITLNILSITMGVYFIVYYCWIIKISRKPI